MQNIKLTIGYDGTKYHGFQLQKNAVTVQEQLEKAICIVFGNPARVNSAIIWSGLLWARWLKWVEASGSQTCVRFCKQKTGI